jgi:hypothetical protein
MSRTATTWMWGLLGLVVVVGLPVLAHWLRQGADPDGCALDGVKLDPAYRVEVVDAEGRTHAFCCPTCARLWLRRQPGPPRAIVVTDEATGQKVEAAAAWYVRSSVVTTPTTGNRVHAFRRRVDAERHAAAFRGTMLPESERPLP